MKTNIKDSNFDNKLITLATKIVGDNINIEEIQKSHLNLIHNLKLILEIKDAYTAGHSERVAEYSVLIGKEMGLDDKDINLLKTGGLVHDIGKLGVDDRILNSESRLTDEEYEIIKKHPVFGVEILGNSEIFKDLIPIVRSHHERYDGKGYPDNLKGENIPFLARIAAVADTFDAMTSSRSYRKALSNEIAKEEIAKNSGTQFDPNIAKVMVNILENKEEEIFKIQKTISCGEPTTKNITDKILKKISKGELLRNLETDKDNSKLSIFLNNELKKEQILLNIYLNYTENIISDKITFKKNILYNLKSDLAIEFNFLIPETTIPDVKPEDIEKYMNIKNKAIKKVEQIKAMGIKNKFNNDYELLLEKTINSKNNNQIIILKMTHYLLNENTKENI